MKEGFVLFVATVIMLSGFAYIVINTAPGV